MTSTYIADLMKRRRGFTLVELVVIIAILGILAAIAVPTVTTVTGGAREGKKDSDLPNVRQATSQYQANNDVLPIVESTDPTVRVSDFNGDGVIVMVVDSAATNPSDFPTSPDVTCGDGATGTTITAALRTCLATIDFTLLVPDLLAQDPDHSTEAVTITAATGADLAITGTDTVGNTLQIHVDDDVASGSALKVWNVDSKNNPIVLKSDDQYGK